WSSDVCSSDLSVAQPGANGCTLAAVPLVKNQGDVRRGSETDELLPRTIGGAIVNDDDFLLHRRRLNLAEQLIDVIKLIVDGNNDRHASLALRDVGSAVIGRNFPTKCGQCHGIQSAEQTCRHTNIGIFLLQRARREVPWPRLTPWKCLGNRAARLKTAGSP